MKSSLVSFVADNSVPPLTKHELPMAHLAYGGIAFGVFLLMLALLWSFRNTAAKPRPQSGRKSGH